jgi:predicted  nucleic acid-binding Zn-ribbon protein
MTEDGSIVINTKIRTDGVKAGTQEIEAGLRRAANRVDNLGTSAKNAINKQIDAFAKLNNEYSAQEQKVESLRQKVASYANQRIPTTEYKEISDQISKAEAKLNQLMSSQERFAANGGKKNTSTYKKMQYDIDELANTIKYARSELVDLEVSGKAFSTGVNTKEAQADMERLASAERRLTDMQNRLNTSYSGIKSKLASYGTGLVSLKEKLFGVNSANNKTANSNSKLSRSFKDASKSAGSARMSIGRMLTMSLLFSGVFRILSALTQGIIGGFNNLAQYSKTTNANISTLWGSLIRLQNAFATAFSPILTVITPILSRFIDLISTAITYVGMFFSYLAGNKTYTKALTVQKNYAASLDKTAKSTKKATKAAKDYLSPLDEINRYTTNKDTDTTPSGSDVNGTPISKMFEEVPIDAPPIFEKIKDVLGQIFQPFKEAWEREGKNTIDAAKYALSELGALAKSVGSSMLEVWTNGTGTQILSTMLQIAQGLLTTVGNIARQLDIAWNKNAVGTAIIQAIADAFQKVLDIINRLVWDTAQWAGSLNFYPLLNSIKNLFESMSPLIEAIGSFLERLYTNIILPMLTWLIESGLPALINVLSGLFNFLGEHQWIVDAIGTALVTAFATSKIVPLIATISSAVLGFAGHIGTLIDILKGGGGLVGAISSLVTTFGIVPIAIAVAVAAIILIATHWDQLKTTMSNLMNWIKGVFATDWHAQFGVFGDVVEVFLNSFKGIFNSIKQICSGFVTFLKVVFAGNVDMALKGILNILRGAANLIYSIFKAPVNMVIALFNGLNRAIINAINGLVDGLNHIKVPDWVPGIGGKGINLSHANYTRIPYLAQGAVIPAGNPFLAVLGDQTKGNNLEMPENLLRKIVSEESGKGTGMIKLVVNLDSRTVLEQLINTAKEMQMSNGQNVFELGR